jgi:hypothetical protein
MLMPGRAPQNGWTPLFIAAHQGHLAMVDLLVAKGADTDALDRVRVGGGEGVLVVQRVFDSWWGLEQGC